MSEDTIIYLCSDLLASFSTIFFFTTKIGICLMNNFFCKINGSSVSFWIIYLKSFANNYFLLPQCHPPTYFLYVSCDIYVKAFLSIYAFVMIGLNICNRNLRIVIWIWAGAGERGRDISTKMTTDLKAYEVLHWRILLLFW